MITTISSLFLFCCSISVASLSFLRMRISSERKHLSITYLTDRARKNSSCVLGMTKSDSDKFLMAKSSIWWVILSDSTNMLCAWEFLMGFQVWDNIMYTLHSTNSEGHNHAPRVICFSFKICKYA